MAGGFFNFFSGKDKTPPEPEKRVAPHWANDATWITSQVFIDKKDKNRRFYYAADQISAGWRTCKYSYLIAAGHCSSDRISYPDTVDEAIQAIAALEKELLEAGYSPVPGLKGNYREAATLHGAYIDDQGNYIKMQEKAPLSKNVLFEGKDLKALYGKPENKPAETVIKTWDDFYREIVYNHPQENLVLSEQDQQDPQFPKIIKEISNTLKIMQALESKGAGNQMEKIVDSFSESAFYRAFEAVQWDKSGTEDSEGGKHKLVYDYEAALLTTLMRMGGKLYQQFTTSLSPPADTVQHLANVSESISTFVQRCFYFSHEKAKQLTNVIMQGPDPYTDKPLPLEVFFKKYQDLLPPAAPKKNKPKPPSAG
jgi:hypothetical protein